ncbi:ATP-binding protein [Agromyces rhizosphaerae]|uniref:ATP-binding protein n=1 Tax=Agromyces rhizosphaerae TaxID=88374 RepID=UPI0024929877|nr:AAA family ATPase [Agromyces rhizosphaerae]
MSEFVPTVPPPPTSSPETFHFDAWRFDARGGRLVGTDGEVSLRPKTAGVLRELLVRAGEVVTKHDLIDAVWGPGGSGDDALAVCVNELRRALGDDRRHPRFIATAHRRGYRFVATLVDPQGARGVPAQLLVGRAGELDTLRGWRNGDGGSRRNVGIVMGELGIGKSALVRAFVDEVRTAGGAWVGEGQCLERTGVGDPYHPFLEALGGVCAGPRGARAREVLASHAPSWLAQLTGAAGETRAAELRSGTAGPSRGRMLREFVAALAELGAESPVLLVCEDLHAGDRASLDLLSALAQRGAPTGVLVLGTARTDEAGTSARGVDLPERIGGLRDTGYLALGPLDAMSARRLLADRGEAQQLDDDEIAALMRRTGGNPLYLGLLADSPAAVTVGGPAAEPAIPEGLRRVVERRIGALAAADRRLLETASVSGVEFSAAAIATVDAPESEPEIDERLARLARGHGLLRELEPAGWPDGTVTARYGFTHSLHRDVLYERLGGARRVLAHRRVGERLAAAFATRPGPAAAAIARHFDRGRDAANAAAWFAHAADTALGRQVPVVALEHSDRALELLDTVRGAADGESTYVDPRTVALEARLRVTRVAAAILAEGVASDRAAEEAAALEVVSARIEDSSALGRIGYVLWSVAFMRGDVRAATRPLERLVAAAAHGDDDGLRLQTANAEAVTTLALGDPVGAREHLERARAVDSPEVRRRLAGAYQDSGVLLRSFAALDEWLLGSTDAARGNAEDALRLARAGSRPDGLAQALSALALVHQLLGDTATVRALAEELRALAEANEFARWRSAARVMIGWTMIEDAPADAAEAIRSGLAEPESVGDGIWAPYHLALLVEAETAAGRIDAAAEVADRAIGLAEASGEVWYLAELTRMRAGLAFAAARESANGRRGRLEREADDLLERSLEIARDQGAHVLELRTLATIAARDLERRGPGRWLRERSGA